MHKALSNTSQCVDYGAQSVKHSDVKSSTRTLYLATQICIDCVKMYDLHKQESKYNPATGGMYVCV